MFRGAVKQTAACVDAGYATPWTVAGLRGLYNGVDIVENAIYTGKAPALHRGDAVRDPGLDRKE